MATTKLFIQNLPFATKEEDLLKLFTQHGKVIDIYIPTDSSKRQKGFAAIEFSTPEEAEKALAALNHIEFNGHQLNIKEFSEKTDIRGRW